MLEPMSAAARAQEEAERDTFLRVAESTTESSIEGMFDAYVIQARVLERLKNVNPMTPSAVAEYNRQCDRVSGMQEMLRELGFRSYELHIGPMWTEESPSHR